MRWFKRINTWITPLKLSGIGPLCHSPQHRAPIPGELQFIAVHFVKIDRLRGAAIGSINSQIEITRSGR